MEIKNVKIEEIKKYSKNNKKHPSAQIEALKNSIQQFGFNQPIVLDESKTILVGHARYEAAVLLNLKIVPCLIIEKLNEGQKRAYRIADNKIAELSEIDFVNFTEELDFLKSVNFDFQAIGIEDLIVNTKEPTNLEVNLDKLSSSDCELKIKLSLEDYDLAIKKLKEINENISIAFLSLLNV